MSKYVLVDEQPYMLEMVSRVTDETLFAAYGKSEFVNTIEGLNKKLYTDPLTGAYNRRYYNDQLCGLLSAANSFALVDVDRFKQVNDSFGHPAGDLALKAVAECCSATCGAPTRSSATAATSFFSSFTISPARRWRKSWRRCASGWRASW